MIVKALLILLSIIQYYTMNAKPVICIILFKIILFMIGKL